MCIFHEYTFYIFFIFVFNISSAKINKCEDSGHPCHTPLLRWKQSVIYPLLFSVKPDLPLVYAFGL